MWTKFRPALGQTYAEGEDRHAAMTSRIGLERAPGSAPNPQRVRRRFLLVGNPIAGSKLSRLLPEVLKELAKRGADVEHAPSRVDSAETPLPSLHGFNAVIAAGGDGTIRAVALEAAACGVPVGIVPVGTGNVMAHEIGLPMRAPALADLLMTGPEFEIRGALANGDPFYLMAGCGFDGEVIRHLDHRVKRVIGKAAYSWPVLRALAARQPLLDITLDGRRTEAAWMIATKSRRYGGSFLLTDKASLVGEHMIAVLFHSTNPIVRLRQLIGLASGSLHRARDVEMIAARDIEVRTSSPVPVEIDGDAAGTTPLHIRAQGPRLKIIVPETYASQHGASK